VAYLEACQARFDATGGYTSADLAVLLERRVLIAASEISTNPRGRILEPGFRVIFAMPTRPAPAGAFRYDATCTPTRTP